MKLFVLIICVLTFSSSIGYSHGNLYVWGSNYNGQFGDGTFQKDADVPTNNGSGVPWKQLAAGKNHSAGVKNDGTLWAWGDNEFGQLGLGSNNDTNSITKITGSTDWNRVYAGDNFTIALKTDGTLWAWGENSHGQLGDGSVIDKNFPMKIGNSPEWKQISAGSNHTCSIKSDGTLWAWGDNTFGQIGDNTFIDKPIPTKIGNATNWKMISAGANHNVAIKSDGTLWTWGNNTFGQMGDASNQHKHHPVQIGIETNWKFVSAGSNHTFAIKTDGTLWAWGYNGFGQLGDGTTTNKDIPVKIGTDTDWKNVEGGQDFSHAIKKDCSVYSWGYNGYGQLGDGTTSNKNTPIQIGSEYDWRQTFCGGFHTLGLKNDGSIWSWGYNLEGQLGDNSNTDKIIPFKSAYAFDWKKISSSDYSSTFVIKKDGSLWKCGDNLYGQLGDGSKIEKSVLTRIGTDNNWKEVVGLYTFVLALKTDGTIWSLGNNFYGQLGDGTNTDRLTFAQIGGDNDWKQISAGINHSVALKNDGTLWSWGGNSEGQLGNGTNNHIKIPTQIGADDNWAKVACGSAFSFAIKNDGTLWSWGWNTSGQLGDGTLVNKLIPVKIGSDIDWQDVSAGDVHTNLIKSDGTRWGMGLNLWGQLGDGTNLDKKIPTKIGTDNDWMKIMSGGYHSIALKTDYSLWGWGFNAYGQVGNGTSSNNIYSPVKISNSKAWASIGIGLYYSMAIKNPEPVPDLWKLMVVTDNSSNIIIPVSIDSKIGERYFMIGDAVGLFYTKGLEHFCGGYGIWDGANLNITVYGDDIATIEKDGFIPNENYTLKIWDGQEGKEYETNVTYSQGNSFYTINGLSVVGSLSAVTEIPRRIVQEIGWNIISINVEPENRNMPVIWNDIKNFVSLVKNNAGQSYIPAFNINQIGNWNKYEGYQVSMTSRQTLEIKGNLIRPEHTPIPLSAGWRLVSYLRNSNMSAPNALNTLVSDNALTLCKNSAGQSYIPQFNINQIGSLQIGQGYQMFLSKNTVLTYPANSFAKSSSVEENITPMPKVLIPEHKFTGNNSILLVKNESPDGNEIGIYNQNDLLIGSGIFHNGIATVTIWGDDEQTEITDGAKINEQLRIKNYDFKTGRLSEIELVDLIDIISDTKLSKFSYSKDAFIIAKSKDISTSSDISLDVVPNPATDKIEIEFNTTDCKASELKIYSITGKLISDLSSQLVELNSYKLSQNISNLISGEYTVILSCGNERAMRKVVVVR